MKAFKKNPEVDLKLKYRKALEVGIIVSLLVMSGVFYSFKKFVSNFELPSQPDITIETIEIPLTQQIQKPPPPFASKYSG
jgi:hypothetical protein